MLYLMHCSRTKFRYGDKLLLHYAGSVWNIELVSHHWRKRTDVVCSLKVAAFAALDSPELRANMNHILLVCSEFACLSIQSVHSRKKIACVVETHLSAIIFSRDLFRHYFCEGNRATMKRRRCLTQNFLHYEHYSVCNVCFSAYFARSGMLTGFTLAFFKITGPSEA